MNEQIFDTFPELDTERLMLRKITIDDDKRLLDVLSDEATCEYLTHNALNDIEAIRRIINGMQMFYEEKKRIRWGIVHKEDGALLGHCGFFDINRYDCSAEISYCLKSDSWGRGIMTEALETMLKFGFEEYGLNRVTAKVIKGNINSFKVLNHLGFVREGVMRASLLKNGRYFDLVIFSLLNSEYHN